MKKGYYYFGECGSMEKILLAIGIIATVISCLWLCRGAARLSSLIFFGLRPGTNDNECPSHRHLHFRPSVSPIIVLYYFWYQYTTEHAITSGVPETECL